MITKICPNCDKVFQTYPSQNKKTCSKQCNAELQKKKSYEKYKKTCLHCGKEFLPPRQAEGGLYCSYECSGLANRRGRINRNGYWYVMKPEHPCCTKQGYVAEHRLIVEQSIGRYLQDCEVVHHLNKDRKDNRIENLELMLDSKHKSHHICESIEAGLLNTPAQRLNAKLRMIANNPSKDIRDEHGRFAKEG